MTKKIMSEMEKIWKMCGYDDDHISILRESRNPSGGDTPHIVIIRGLPGSGKSTMAKQKYKDYKHLEADMFFMDDEGNYNFDPKRLKQAHEWCLSQAEKALRAGENVVVSNTFVKKWEFKKYVELASQYGTKLTVTTATGNYGSIHDVPDHAIARMKSNWEAFPNQTWDLNQQ